MARVFGRAWGAVVLVACGGGTVPLACAPSSASSAAAAAPSNPQATSGRECVIAPQEPAEIRQWRADGSAAVEARLAATEPCFAKVDQEVFLYITMPQSGTAERKVLLTGTTFDDCNVTKCVVAALRKIELPPPPKVDDPDRLFLQEYIAFDPSATPRVHLSATPDVPLSPEGPCVDKDLLPKSGKLDPVHIQTVVRGAAPDMRRCYEAGLARNSSLQGRVTTRFVVGADGKVDSVSTPDNSLPDCDAVACIREIFGRLQFERPNGGPVTVVYPLIFDPQ
jgi:hypothetical protein